VSENDQEQGGPLFRVAWIAGVKRHFPGVPKEGYIAPWERMQSWEQEAASETYRQLRAFILAGIENGEAVHLTREQGGRLVRSLWVNQMYKHFASSSSSPKEAYVCAWEQMVNQWEQEVDMDIYQEIERVVLQGQAQV
jgi:hypothetical protein